MLPAYRVLVFGASYGSLFATKVAAAGHDATLICQRATAELINREGTRVLFPVKGGAPVEVASPTLPGAVSAATTSTVDPSEYDLAVLAMQEPQYGARGRARAARPYREGGACPACRS